MASKNQIIEKTIKHKITTTFSYRKGDSNLDFTLPTETDKYLKIYKELLQKAIVDIDDELKEFKN